MSESWTNPSAILRDLRFTQGRDVAHGQTLTLIEDIPKFAVAEEGDEDEYYNYYGMTPDSSADFSNGPDVDSISEMLSMLRNTTDEYPKPIERCRYDNQPVSSLLVNKPKSTTAKDGTHHLTNRVGRNVAIQSLIENAQAFTSLSSSSIYDTAPTDGVDVNVMSFPPLPSPSSTKIANGSKKRNEIGKEINIKTPVQPRPSSSSSSPSLNFAAAAKTGKKTGNPLKDKPTAGRLGPKQYVPTPRSQKLFEKILLEDSIREMLHECVLSVADKEMDLIDERNEKAAELAVEAQKNLMLLGYDFPLKICLPQQRHLISDDCIVCKVLCTNADEANNIQSITLKDISIPIQSTNEVENDLIILRDETDKLNLSTSLDEKEMFVNNSFSEQDSLVSYNSKESHDISIVGSEDSSFEVSDFKMNVREADYKVKEFKSALNGSDSSSNANNVNMNLYGARSEANNSTTSNFKVITKSQINVDSLDDFKCFENEISSALDSDDYETDDLDFQANESISAPNVTNNTGASRKHDVIQSIPNKIEVTNVVKQSISKKDLQNEVEVEEKTDNNKLPKQTYLRLLQFLQKSVSEDASTRLSANHS